MPELKMVTLFTIIINKNCKIRAYSTLVKELKAKS